MKKLILLMVIALMTVTSMVGACCVRSELVHRSMHVAQF